MLNDIILLVSIVASIPICEPGFTLNADKTDCEGMIIYTFWLKGDDYILSLNEV